MEWRARRPSAEGTTFLIDYELLGASATGLDLIQALKIHEQSVLVTSRYEEQAIVERCRLTGVRLLPKATAPYVPITVHAAEAVLIDDDPVIHLMWKKSAEGAGKKLTTFSNADDFLSRSTDFATDTPVYLDSKLGNGIRGEVVAPQIHARGFTEIYLVTGFSPDDFEPRPEIRAVLGKKPPWENSRKRVPTVVHEGENI